jgi:hypothetical protein
VNMIIPRATWGARYGQGQATAGIKGRVVVHHDGFTRLTPSATYDDEIRLIRMFETYHVETKGWNGIAYSFVIMPFSGRIFEGRGWGRVGSHTAGFNSSAYGVQFAMDGTSAEPTPAALEAFRWLRVEGVRLKHLTPAHIVSGHRDHNAGTSCPGNRLYDLTVRGAKPLAQYITPAQAVASQPTLRLGKGGKDAPKDIRDAVAYLQRRLQQRGFLVRTTPSGAPTDSGYFGPMTDQAVRRFQTAERLFADGVVGAKTWRALDA